jgi:hypothetical protein
MTLQRNPICIFFLQLLWFFFVSLCPAVGHSKIKTKRFVLNNKQLRKKKEEKSKKKKGKCQERFR